MVPVVQEPRLSYVVLEGVSRNAGECHGRESEKEGRVKIALGDTPSSPAPSADSGQAPGLCPSVLPIVALRMTSALPDRAQRAG